MEKDWIIEQVDFNKRSVIEHYESLFTLGNGYLGLKGDLPYGEELDKSGTYINGFYEKGPITYGEKAFGFAENWQTMIPIPEGKYIDFEVEGVKLFNNSGKFIESRRILNMKDSNSIWTFVWEDENSKIYGGSLKTTIPFDFNGTVIFQWNIELPVDDMEIKVKSPLFYPESKDNNSNDPRISAHFNGKSVQLLKNNFRDKYNQLILRTTGSELSLVSQMDNTFNGLDIKSDSVLEFDNSIERIIEGRCGKSISINKSVTYSYGPSKNIVLIQDRVAEETLFIKSQGLKNIESNQKQFMQNFWSNSDISIGGDLEAQISLRFNLFQLLQSVGRDGKRSIAAKGLSGPGYEGHYFWDAETYVLPFFIYTNPEIAKSMLLYRISILDRAKERAEVLGHDGILFPWRTINGEESSAYFPAGTAQYHINADIALGLIKYIEISGDIDILELGGDRILSGTADFWCSLASFIPGKGFCFNMVTGPDEYTALVDNNYYTNLTAKENLLQAALWLKDRVSDKTLKKWIDTANNIYLPKNVEVTPQDDSFLEKEVWDLKNTDKSKHPLLLHFHPLNIYRKQVLKQADVVMAQALHRNHFPPGLMKRNFDYYEPLTTRDSSLSACAQGIVAFWLGYDDLCWEYFLETLHTDRKDVHNNVSHGLHTASMGGSYLMILNGFLGIDNYKGTIRLRPRLPKELRYIKTNLTINGAVVQIELYKGKISYTTNDSKITLYHYSHQVDLEPNKTETLRTDPINKIEVKDIENKFGFELETEIFRSISEMGYLPEESFLETSKADRKELIESLGFKIK